MSRSPAICRILLTIDHLARIEGYDKEMQSLGLRGGACSSLLMHDTKRSTFYDAGLGDTATIHFWSNNKTGAWKPHRPVKAHGSDNEAEIARFVSSATHEAGRIES